MNRDDNDNINTNDNNNFIKLEYIGDPSIRLREKINRIFQKLNIEVKIVFKTFKVKNYFVLKDRIQKLMKSKVIYHFQCQVDPECQYLGKTKRRLHQRVEEHLKTNTAISPHLGTCVDCTNNLNDRFKVVYTGKTEFEINIVEALKILEERPKLNRMLNNDGNAYFLKVFN